MFRYCMVLFAGIAAEALIYGEAEGGENDENLFRSVCVLLEPPLTITQVFLFSETVMLGKLNALQIYFQISKLLVLYGFSY